MKKIKLLTLACLLVGGAAVFTACSDRIATPTGLSVDIDNKLTWTAVEDARRYDIEIKDMATGEKKSVTAKKESYSLSRLNEGEYEIRVKAIAGNKSDDDSKWSSVYFFSKDYETGCVYTLVNNVEYEITKSGTASGKVVIEDTYRGKPVTGIADGAFRGNGSITEVVVGNNVEYIGKNAFYNCSGLTSITIPDSVTSIGEAAFQSCKSLQSIEIPDSVTTIEANTFAYCRALNTVDFENVTSIGEAAFSDCSALKEITLPDSVLLVGAYAFSANSLLEKVNVGSGLVYVDNYAFYRCKGLTEVNFGEKSSLLSLGEYSFAECSKLATIALPEGLKEIGGAAFYQCELLDDVAIPDSVEYVREYAFSGTKTYTDAIEAKKPFVFIDDWLVYCTVKSTLYQLDANTFTTQEKAEEGQKPEENTYAYEKPIVGIADGVFRACRKLAIVDLGSSVKYIGYRSFYNNSSLMQVTLYKSNVETIGEYAFAQCKILTTLNLKSVTGTSPIKTIGAYAFYGCSSLDNSTLGGSFIPDSVTSIGTYAFKKTKLWDSPATPSSDGVVYAGNWIVGYNGDNITEVTIKDNTRGVADYAFYNCATLKAVKKLDIVKLVGRGAFYKCSSLEVANLNTDVTEILPYTFYKCTSLMSIDLPRKLTTIGRSAFYKCEKLNELTLKTSIKNVDDYAFYGCINIKKLTLNNGVERIGDYAFYNCATLEELTVTDSVKKLGVRSFGNCTSLKTLTLGEGLTSIGERAFQNCASLEKLTIPSNVKTLEPYAFYKATGLREIVFEEGLETIGNYAFYGAENLYRAHFPLSLKSIGKYAFKGCNGLQSVLLRSTVEEIDAHAFYGCKQATVYTEVTEFPFDWHVRLNSSYRPLVWGVTLSEDKTYVQSLTVGEKTFLNVTEEKSLTAPQRKGYKFVRWEATVNGVEITYQANEANLAPVGTVLTAVWEEGEPTIPELPKDEPAEGTKDAQTAK